MLQRSLALGRRLQYRNDSTVYHVVVQRAASDNQEGDIRVSWVCEDTKAENEAAIK